MIPALPNCRTESSGLAWTMYQDSVERKEGKEEGKEKRGKERKEISDGKPQCSIQYTLGIKNLLHKRKLIIQTTSLSLWEDLQSVPHTLSFLSQPLGNTSVLLSPNYMYPL